MKRGALVVVSMVDMEHDDFGWQPIAETRRRKAGRYQAVGWVVKTTRRFLVIAPVATREASATFCAYRIPRGAIRSVRRIA